MNSLALDHVIVFGLCEAREDLRRCAQLRVQGLVARDAPLSELLQAIHTVAADGHFQSASLAQDITEVIAATTPVERLTERERQIAELIACGYSNRIVGAELRLRPGTLKTHLRAIFRKYRVHTRGELASHVGYSSEGASIATADSSGTRGARSTGNPAG